MSLEPKKPEAGDTRILIVDGIMMLQVRIDNVRTYGDLWVDVPSVQLGQLISTDHTGQISVRAVVEPGAIAMVSPKSVAATSQWSPEQLEKARLTAEAQDQSFTELCAS